MHRALVLLWIALLAACAGGPPPTAIAQAGGIVIRATALPFNLEDPADRRTGRLIWRGGVALTASNPAFGGWSGLHVAPDGSSLSAISDVGHWLTARIVQDAAGTLTGLADARFGPLRGLDGKPLGDKRSADAESLARLADGSWLVAFEQRHRLWRYPAGDEANGAGLAGLPVPVEGPADLGRQPANGGLEALAALPDGRIVGLSEVYSKRPGTSVGWIGAPSDTGWRWQEFGYTATPDYKPTALAVLPDGDLVVVERAFSPALGVRCRVLRLAVGAIAAGATVQAVELARLASPLAVDNLEGVAATRGPRGETLIWLISDDNFNPLQRTILLKFELAP